MRDEELENKLKECEAIKFGDFTLVSGKKTKYYVDIKKAVTKPKLLELINRRIVDMINSFDIKADYIACVELGAIPIGVMVSVTTGLPLIIIRKTQRHHGLKTRIVGDIEKGRIALFVEDVMTTGGSIINAAKLLRDEGMIVKKVISVVDRDEITEDTLTKEGLTLISLVSAKSLLEDYEAVSKHSDGVKTSEEIST